MLYESVCEQVFLTCLQTCSNISSQTNSEHVRLLSKRTTNENERALEKNKHK